LENVNDIVTATHCSTLQQLQRTVHLVIFVDKRQRHRYRHTLQHSATHCIALHRTATLCTSFPLLKNANDIAAAGSACAAGVCAFICVCVCVSSSWLEGPPVCRLITILKNQLYRYLTWKIE